MEDFYGTDVIPGGLTIISDEFNTITVDQNGIARPLLPRTYNFFSQMAGENAESRIYLGIHWQFDAIEGIRSGDGIGDYVFTNALTPLHGPRPVALPSMDALQQIRLSVLLENVAATGGLSLGKHDFGEQIVADVLLNPSVLSTLKSVFANPPPKNPSALSSFTATTSGYSAANAAVFWWDFQTGKSYTALDDVLQLVQALSQDVNAGGKGLGGQF